VSHLLLILHLEDYFDFQHFNVSSFVEDKEYQNTVVKGWIGTVKYTYA